MTTVELPAVCDRLTEHGLAFAIFIENDTGKICVTSPEGMVRINPGRDCADLAVMLAAHCDDNGLRGFVASEWGEIEPNDDEDLPTCGDLSPTITIETEYGPATGQPPCVLHPDHVGDHRASELWDEVTW